MNRAANVIYIMLSSKLKESKRKTKLAILFLLPDFPGFFIVLRKLALLSEAVKADKTPPLILSAGSKIPFEINIDQTLFYTKE